MGATLKMQPRCDEGEVATPCPARSPWLLGGWECSDAVCWQGSTLLYSFVTLCAASLPITFDVTVAPGPPLEDWTYPLPLKVCLVVRFHLVHGPVSCSFPMCWLTMASFAGHRHRLPFDRVTAPFPAIPQRFSVFPRFPSIFSPKPGGNLLAGCLLVSLVAKEVRWRVPYSSSRLNQDREPNRSNKRWGNAIMDTLMDGCPQRLVFLVFILDRIPPNFPGYHGFASIVTPGLWTPRRGVPSYPCGSKSDPTGSERREPLRFVALKGLAQG